MDILGRMVDRAVESSLFNGFLVGKEKVSISHLQYADDTICFIKNDGSVHKLFVIRKTFCAISGMKINMHKSQILGLNMDKGAVESLANLVGCEVGQWPLKY